MSEQKKPRVLIAGASGFIGSALLPYLQEQGHDARVLIRDRRSYSPLGFYWDPIKSKIDERAFDGVRYVINLCGENIASGRWTELKKTRLRRSRIGSTKALASMIAALGTRDITLINASATGFYGNRGEEILTEESSSGDGFLAHLTHDWEQATGLLKKYDVKVACLRFGIVLGPHGGFFDKLRRPFKLGLGGRIGPGTQYMSWIALSDAVRAIHHVMTHSLEGPVNVVSPNAVTNAELARMLAETFKKPLFFPLPAGVARMLFGTEMANETILASTRVAPIALLRTGFEFRCPDLSTALSLAAASYE